MSEEKRYRFRVTLEYMNEYGEEIVEDDLDHPPTGEDFRAALMEGLTNMADLSIELLADEDDA